MKRIVAILLSIGAVLLGLLFCLWLFHGPPKETKLIRNFYAHRAAFELLRDMLKVDIQVRRVADWGVETDKGVSKPPNGNFSIERYNKYLALLKETGGIAAVRYEGAHANPTVLVWAAGFGGDAAHICICWQDEVPQRQVSSFDKYYRDHKSSDGIGPVYQHIDGNRYLWTDLWTQ